MPLIFAIQIRDIHVRKKQKSSQLKFVKFQINLNEVAKNQYLLRTFLQIIKIVSPNNSQGCPLKGR